MIYSIGSYDYQYDNTGVNMDEPLSGYRPFTIEYMIKEFKFQLSMQYKLHNCFLYELSRSIETILEKNTKLCVIIDLIITFLYNNYSIEPIIIDDIILHLCKAIHKWHYGIITPFIYNGSIKMHYKRTLKELYPVAQEMMYRPGRLGYMEAMSNFQAVRNAF